MTFMTEIKTVTLKDKIFQPTLLFKRPLVILKK